MLMTAGFLLLRFGLSDVAGVVDPQTNSYTALETRMSGPTSAAAFPGIETKDAAQSRLLLQQNACQVEVLARVMPLNAKRVAEADRGGADPGTVAKMLFAVTLRLDPVSVDAINGCLVALPETDPTLPKAGEASYLTTSETAANAFPWVNTEEWGVIKSALVKDQAVIARAAEESSVDSRLIVSVAMVEQLRLYFTQRELYEKFFRPLKVLGNATKMAWGVMSIKEQTAIQVEQHLQDPSSAFYLGPTRQHLLDLPEEKESDTRFSRLTDEKQHYYSYLYGALELAQFAEQWRRAGFVIGDRPEILATLFNLGFRFSKPKADPQVGGSTIDIGDQHYTFGSLAFEFYYSGELAQEFPYQTKVPPLPKSE